MQLREKKVILTGPTSGIGKAMLDHLVAEGNTVLATSRNACRLGERADYPPSVRFFNCDVTSEATVLEMVREAKRFLQTVELVINNAGHLHRGPVASTSLADWRAVIETNLTGSFLLLKHLLPILVSQGYGTVINVGSAEAVNCTPGMASYSASKSALSALTRTAAREVLQHPGVLIVGLLPGDIRTTMNPTGSEDASAAVRRLHELLETLEPRHSGALFVRGRFAVPSFAFPRD